MHPKRPRDFNKLAQSIMDIATEKSLTAISVFSPSGRHN